MKTFNLLFLAGLLLINTLIKQEPPELKEAATLTESASKLFDDGKYDEALANTKKALEIQERLLPRTDTRIIASLISLSDIYIVKRDFDEATKALERVLGILSERSGPGNIPLAPSWDRRVASSFFAMGEFYRSKKDFNRAAPNYKRALSIYGKTSGIKSEDFERTSDGFICLAFAADKENSIKDLNEIRNQFAPNSEVPILNGKALTLPRPPYPAEARERRLSGIVIVKVTIDENGNVIAAHDLCQGSPYLSEGSLISARGARFAPTLEGGKPVKVTGVIRYKYVVQ